MKVGSKVIRGLRPTNKLLNSINYTLSILCI